MMLEFLSAVTLNMSKCNDMKKIYSILRHDPTARFLLKFIKGPIRTFLKIHP